MSEIRKRKKHLLLSLSALSLLASAMVILLTHIHKSTVTETVWNPKPADPEFFVRIFTREEIKLHNKGRREGIVAKIEEIEIDEEGNIYILDTIDHDIKKLNSHGIYLLTIGQKGRGPGELLFSNPFAYLRVWKNFLYVTDSGNGRIVIFNKDDGSFLKSFKVNINKFSGIAIGPNGTIFVLSYRPSDEKMIHVYDSDGNTLSSFGYIGLHAPEQYRMKIYGYYSEGSIDIDSEGKIYYSPLTPITNKVFSGKGNLIKIFSRKYPFFRYPNFYKKIDVGFPALAKMKIVNDEFVFNVIEVREGRRKKIIDIYGIEGVLLKSDIFLPFEVKDLWIKKVDDRGNLYFVKYPPESAEPVILKYSFHPEVFSTSISK